MGNRERSRIKKMNFDNFVNNRVLEGFSSIVVSYENHVLNKPVNALGTVWSKSQEEVLAPLTVPKVSNSYKRFTQRFVFGPDHYLCFLDRHH